MAKILYILSNTNRDGCTLSFMTMLRGVLAEGYEAVVVIPDGRPEFCQEMQNLQVRHYVVPMTFNCWPKFFGLKRLLGYPVVLLREQAEQRKTRHLLEQIMQMEHPDIVHTNVGPLDVGHYASKKYGIPHVWHIREYGDLDFNLHLFPSKRVFRHKLEADYTICITQNLQLYNQLDGCSRSHVIYNGVRSQRETCYCPEKQKFFLMASRVSVEKGHERMIGIFARFCLSHSDYKLVILGDGIEWFVSRCKSLVKELDVEQNVIFEGFKNDTDRYMREATALLVASPSEGFGRMTAEATFNGCLVVGYAAAGTKEILDETKGGFLWKTDEECLEAMETVVNLSSWEYENKVLAAQRVAQNLYSTESYVSRVLDVYNENIMN